MTPKEALDYLDSIAPGFAKWLKALAAYVEAQGDQYPSDWTPLPLHEWLEMIDQLH